MIVVIGFLVAVVLALGYLIWDTIRGKYDEEEL